MPTETTGSVLFSHQEINQPRQELRSIPQRRKMICLGIYMSRCTEVDIVITDIDIYTYTIYR